RRVRKTTICNWLRWSRKTGRALPWRGCRRWWNVQLAVAPHDGGWRSGAQGIRPRILVPRAAQPGRSAAGGGGLAAAASGRQPAAVSQRHGRQAAGADRTESLRAAAATERADAG